MQFVKAENGLTWVREYWPKHNDRLKSASLLLASPGTPQNLPPGMKYRSRNSIGDISYLRGTADDIRTITSFIQRTYNPQEHIRPQILAEVGLTLNVAREQIKQFFKKPDNIWRDCTSDDIAYFILYYTGHGEVSNGDWVFNGGCLSFADIRTEWMAAKRAPNQLLMIDIGQLFFWQMDRTCKKGALTCVQQQPTVMFYWPHYFSNGNGTE